MRIFFTIVWLLMGLCSQPLQAQVAEKGELTSFVEFGATVHRGRHVPLWQVSNYHGLSSLDNHTYLRGAAFYGKSVGQWEVKAALDMAVAAGFTSTFVVQQAYVDATYKWLGLSFGSKELDSPLLNQELSSGGLTWSGNAKPIPQVWIGLPEYLQVLPKLSLKGELSYGWFTDNGYQEKTVGEGSWYTRNIKYHHKALFLRIGIPQGKWQLDLGLVMDTQFGGKKVGGVDEGDLGNSLSDYLHALIPTHGGSDKPFGEQVAFQGNFLGSEHIRLTHRHQEFELSAYLENFYDDFTGMGKFNGMDGLWGLEWKMTKPSVIDGVVIEYYQSTDQSGPMHGIDNSVVKKTGGADDYYNNDWYPGWVHWGMTMGNPLVASPIYNGDGYMAFKYNRVRALHLGFGGKVREGWRYVAKLSFNRTWGTPFRPTPSILENFSIFAAAYYTPTKRLPGWSFKAGLALDMGDIYGNNVGLQLNIHKTL